MLNTLVDYTRPDSVSPVSGIPSNWNRSDYNRSQLAYERLAELVGKLNAKFILVSFNSEGFISREAMISLLEQFGALTILETKYNTFRGSRNLSGRNIHVKEYLYLIEKR
jgi:adenine-specific DNA-methyltransferase